jgi:hypothetical protein
MEEALDGVNLVLHNATVLDLEFDPPNNVVSMSLSVTTAPKTGPTPARARLRLSP